MTSAWSPTDAGVREPMASRWSPSSFDPAHELSDAELTALAEAARWAPSRGNSQPWVMVVVRRGGPGREAFEATLTRGNAWVRRASVVLVSCVRTGPDPDVLALGGPDSKAARVPPADYACHDTGQAAAHVTLQARAMGLDAHQFSGMDLDAAGAALGVPAHFRVLAGIAVGRHLPPAGPGAPEGLEDLAGREARPRVRRELAVAVRDGGWGRGWAAGPER